MNNSTLLRNWTLVDYTKRPDWFVPLAFNVFLVFLMLWIIISLVHHGIRNKKWRRSIEQNNFQKLNSGWIYSSVLLCAVICLVRFTVTITIMNTGFQPEDDYLCTILSDLQSSMYVLVQMSVLFFLWLRQRAFYTNAMLAVSYTKPVLFFSMISIGLILIAAVGFNVFSSLPDDRRSSPDGCIYVADGSSKIGYWIFLALTIIFVHAILFGLLFYALRKSKNSDKKPKESGDVHASNSNQGRPASKSQSTSSRDISLESLNTVVSHTSRNVVTTSQTPTKSPVKTANSSKAKKSKHPIKKTLLKTFVFAIISVFADFFLSIIWLFITVNDRILVTFYNFNALLSLLLIIFSFSCYKKMLFSVCFSKK